MTNFVHGLEITFMAVSLACLFISLLTLREALIDETIVAARESTGPRKLIADQNVREEVIKLACSSILVLAGAGALVLEPFPPEYHQHPQAVTSILSWLVLAFLLMMSSLLSRIVRKELQQHYANEANLKRRKDDKS